MDKIRKILVMTDEEELRHVLEFCFDGWGYEVFFDSGTSTDISRIIRIAPDVIVVDVLSATKERLEVCDLLKKDFATTQIPVITLVDKRYLKKELLNLRQAVDDYVVKPPDPLELRVRVEMAVKRSHQSFYASPLTGLPGSTVIEEMLRDKIRGNAHFVVGHIDIDNFKSFNDKYGYMPGDRVIIQTAYMLSNAVRSWGNKGDFVGHIGGDDFVIITTPDKYNSVCRNFICMFDTIIPFHYSPEHRREGHITTRDRTGRVRKIPLMSVTIALVMRTGKKDMKTLIELNERIAEVKQYLKKIPGSKYLADRRILEKNDHLKVQVFRNQEGIMKRYKPLGQILLEDNVITVEQLDDALKVHWKSGVFLGEILKELGYLSEEKLSEALARQEHELERNRKDKSK